MATGVAGMVAADLMGARGGNVLWRTAAAMVAQGVVKVRRVAPTALVESCLGPCSGVTAAQP